MAKVKSNIPIKLIARATGASKGQVVAVARAIEQAIKDSTMVDSASVCKCADCKGSFEWF